MAETNRWDIRQVYLYLVCFATLMMLIVGSVQLINGLVQVIYPDPYMGSKVPLYYDIKQQNSSISQEEMHRQIEEDRKHQELSMRRSQVINLVNSTTLILVSLPIYIYHWRKVQRKET